MVDWIVRHHRLGLAVVAVATAGSICLLLRPGLREDYRLEAFVGSSDESYYRFRRFMDTFTSNEVAIIAVQTADALSPESSQITRELLEQVRSLAAVERAQALTEFSPVVLKLVGKRLTRHRLVLDNLLSRDGRTAAIVLQMQGEGQTPAGRRQTVARLREVVADGQSRHPEARIVLAGPYVSLIDMYEYVDRDLLVFSVAAFALVGVTLGLVFRRSGPMLFAILVGASATLCALGAAIALNLTTSLITQMVVILVMVLAVANCVHLAVASEETAAGHAGEPGRFRAARTLRRMLAPCTAVVVTTAAGFASVGISAITPVRILGLLMVCGLAVSLVAALAASVLLTGPGHYTISGRSPRLPAALAAVVRWADRRRGTVLVLFAVAGAASAAAVGRLRFESDFVENFRPQSEVRTSYRFIEENLSPVGSMEIVIRTTDRADILTPRNVRRARELGDSIVEKHGPIRKAMSLADLTTLVSADLPGTDIGLRSRLALARQVFGHDFQRNFLNAAGTAMRINLRAEEGVGVHDKLAIADDVRQMAEEVFPEGEGFAVEVTGLYPFYAGLVSGLLRDQYRSFGLTVPAVFVVLALVFRSIKVALVAMVPNLLPILFCLGAMGWSGIPVNMTTAMMLSVTLGIAVDDTLHFMWRYRDELSRCGDTTEALAATARSVGRACFFTTVVITGGFWILMLSQFLPTAYFGGLIGFTMLGTLAADLVLLPVLLVLFRVFASDAGPEDAILVRSRCV